MISRIRGFRNETKNRLILFTVVFLSGFTALLYQIIWIKEFELFFGTHIYAISAVLTAFMAGLGLGSLLAGKLADKSRNPWWLLLGIEAGLALFALFFGNLFSGLIDVYKAWTPEEIFSTLSVNLLRFALAFIFLLPPSLFIGATLPVFMKILVNSFYKIGSKSSWYYAVNNLGAFIGCLLTGFFLIRFFGLTKSLQFAAVINILIILLIIHHLLTSTAGKQEAAGEEKQGSNSLVLQRKLVYLVLVVFTVEGFTTLAYEVLWTRILTEFSYDKTTYLFTVILMSYIFGLSAGSFFIYKKIDRLKNPVRWLAYIQVMIGLLSILSLILASRFMPVMIHGRDISKSWFQTSGIEYIIVFLMLSLPVFLMGMTFPLVSRIYNTNMKKLGEKFGMIGFLDVAGSVLGSSVTALILIPFLGTVFSLLVVALLNIIPAMVLIGNDVKYSLKTKKRLILSFILITTICIPFLPSDRYFKTQIGKREGEKILFYSEGVGGTVSVHSYGMGKTALAINGALYAFTNIDDALSHRLLAYMPVFYHPEPEEVLVIGYGMGITASSFVRPETKHINIAEINPEIPRAANMFFSSQNRNLAGYTGLNLINDDGRSWLISTDKKYDIITCDATHPRYGDNLYTSEFYSICNEHLEKGGVMCNWMPVNWLSEKEYKSMIKSFTDVFEYATLWYINRGVCLVVGSNDELVLDPGRLNEMFGDPLIRGDMYSVEIVNPASLFARRIADRKELVEWVGDVRANTDDCPVVEYGRTASMAPNREVLNWVLNRMERNDLLESEEEDVRFDEQFMKLIGLYREILASDIKMDIERL